MTNDQWLAVDRKGLAQLLEKRGKAFALFELIQNALDTDATFVRVSLAPVEGRPLATLIVQDDHPDGFADLTHAFTMFAPSSKKTDATKRGRFNMGEKLVLALCETASVQSTRGTVRFNADGTRSRSQAKTQTGTVFMATIRMTRAELEDCERQIHTLIPPSDKAVWFNDGRIPSREPVTVVRDVGLATQISDDEGNLRMSSRKTEIRIFAVQAGETAMLYEMGIPVVETGDLFHYDVAQKVPLNMDRDNVTPAYLRSVRAATLNVVTESVVFTQEEASAPWVTDALGSRLMTAEAVKEIVRDRFGEKAAIYDPSDVNASHDLVSKGWNVVHGGSLPKSAWEAVKSANAMQPAGKIAPTPRPYSDDPDAPEARLLPMEEWTRPMVALRTFVQRLAAAGVIDGQLGKRVLVRVIDGPRDFAAAYGDGMLDMFVSALGVSWFKTAPLEDVLDLLIHEFSHNTASDHLDARYHKACTKVGARFALALVRDPTLLTAYIAERGSDAALSKNELAA